MNYFISFFTPQKKIDTLFRYFMIIKREIEKIALQLFNVLFFFDLTKKKKKNKNEFTIEKNSEIKKKKIKTKIRK